MIRYTEKKFPSYSYVPGLKPHPISDPNGHSYGEEHVNVSPIMPDFWRESEYFLYGVDLFNFHFYWESHEAWESLWHAAGRKGTIADFLKGLIKLAAAAVKAREGNPTGVLRHTKRALELFEVVRAANTIYCGVRIQQLINSTELFRENSSEYVAPNAHLELPISIKLDS